MQIGHRGRQEGGFSLVEMLVVLAVVLIMAVIAIPSIVQYVQGYRLNGGSEQVAAMLQKTRTTAVMKNVRVGVVFSIEDATRYRYYISDGQVNRKEAAALGVAPNAGQVLDRGNIVGTSVERIQAGNLTQLPDDIEFTNSSAACPGLAANASMIRFNGLGTHCQPGVGGCLPFTPGTGTNYIEYDPLGRWARLCVTDTRSGDARLISIAMGGRVRNERMVTP